MITAADLDRMKAEKARLAEEARLAKEKAKAERAARAEAKRQAAAERAAQRAAPRSRRFSTTPPPPTHLPPVAPPPPSPTPVVEAWAMPYEPPDYRFDPSADPLVELAARELCRRRLLPFIQRFRPKYLADWVHEDICRRLERFVAQVEAMQSPRLMINVPVRTGKLLADETWVPVPTGEGRDGPAGWKRHGELTTGDWVFHPSGRSIQVMFTGRRNMADVEVEFTDGGKVLCHGDHEWPVYIPEKGHYRVFTTWQLLRLAEWAPWNNLPLIWMSARWLERQPALRAVRRLPPDQAKPGHCIQVSSPDGLYVIADETRTKFYPTHNSEISSRHFPAWILGRHPEWEVIAASHTASLSLSFSRYLRDLMRDPAYLAVFPEARLDPQSQSVENWNLVKGGGYLAAGRGSGISGRGAHILLLDDLIKDMEEADSAVVRDSTMDWYYSTALTRLAPGGGVVAVLTQWHSDDWSGRIQEAMATGEGDNFEVVRYPAINDIGDEYILPDDTIAQWPPESPEPPPPGSRLTRPRGTAVHPKRYTTEMMRAARRNLIASGQKRVWDALYQQNPLPDEGIYFDKDSFRYRPPPPLSEMYLYQAWDFAISEKKTSDYTVGVCIGVDMRDDVYVLDMRRFRSQDGIAIVESILDFALHYAALGKSLTLGFEDGQIWKAISAQFAKRCEERRYYPAHEVLVPLTDKLVRASPLKGRMQLGKVCFDKSAPWFTELDKELRQFPSGKNDDIVDAMSWSVRLTLGRAPPRAPEAPKKLPSWKDKLPGLKSGRSYMAA
jgi:predicted phage terminase large subunit-like protein